MKKIILFILLISCGFCMGQSWSTGVVTLDTDFTVQFDVDSSTGLVTMTMIGPSSRWLGVGPGVAANNSMGNLGDDAVVFNSSGLEDRNMPAGTGTPNLDASQDWTLVSDNVTGGTTRTVVATRAINTGDPNDFVFPSNAGSLPILWAKGGSMTFGYHTGGRGGTVANLTLGLGDLSFSRFTMSPNPSATNFTVTLPQQNGKGAAIEVFNLLGVKIYEKQFTNQNTTVDVSTWNTGIYLVKVTSENTSVTKRFVKR